jgi:hypothetical protein
MVDAHLFESKVETVNQCDSGVLRELEAGSLEPGAWRHEPRWTFESWYGFSSLLYFRFLLRKALIFSWARGAFSMLTYFIPLVLLICVAILVNSRPDGY